MPDKQAFVYVGNAQSRTISAFRWDLSSGALAAIETVPIPGAPSEYSLPLAVDRTLGVLWVALRHEPFAIRAYAIDRNSGKLADAGSVPSRDTCYMASDCAHRFLLAASLFNSAITVHALDADGLPRVAHQTITVPKAHCILPAPDNRHVLTTTLSGGVIHQWKFDAASGLLAPNDPPHVGTNPGGGARHLVFRPDARFVYLQNQDDNSIETFAYSAAAGTLSHRQTLGLDVPGAVRDAGKFRAAGLSITEDGRFLFAVERGTSIMTTLRTDPASGLVSIVEQKRTEKQPWGVGLSPDGRYLCATGHLSDRISVYALDENGRRGRTVSEGRVGSGANCTVVWH